MQQESVKISQGHHYQTSFEELPNIHDPDQFDLCQGQISDILFQ